MRFAPFVLALTLVASSLATSSLAAAPLEERFIVNAQYRNGINKAFKDLGKGLVRYNRGEAGQFSLSIAGTMKNPENGDIYKMRVSGNFKLEGRSIIKLTQKIEFNEEAKKYEKLMTENLPFVFLARFQSLPPGTEADEVTYRYEGRDYRMRYVPMDGTVEATLFQGDTQIGKFFLEGKSGQPPKGLAKARMIGPDHLVFSLVIDTRDAAERGE